MNDTALDEFQLMNCSARGHGVFTTREFFRGDIVMVGVIEKELGANHSHASQIGKDRYVFHAGLISKVNHSCAPNCGIHVNETGAHDFIAMKHIRASQEVTFDYAMRNYGVDHFPDVCICGAPALDFANTIAGWNMTPRDWLDGYDRLADWAHQAGVMSPEVAAALKRAAEEHPDAAAAALEEARALRNDIHEYFSAIASQRNPDENVVERLFSRWRDATDRHAPIVVDGRIVLEPEENAEQLGVIADRLAYVAFELAREVEPARLRICDGVNCGWLFIDTSKAGRRRWCDMATCGNAAKSKRHQARKGG